MLFRTSVTIVFQDVEIRTMVPVFPCICFHIENLPNSISIGIEEQKGIVSNMSRRSTFQKEYKSSKTKMYKGFSMIPLNRNTD